jgi:hypothetical protein
LAAAFAMALPAFTKHPSVLEDAWLIASEKSGRVPAYVLKPEALSASVLWFAVQRRFWQGCSAQLDTLLAALKETDTES